MQSISHGGPVYRRAYDALLRQTDGWRSVGVWNDADGQTKGRVLTTMTRAATALWPEVMERLDD